MNAITNLARLVVWISGGVHVVIGLLFWMGLAAGLSWAYVVNGVILIISVWALAVLAAIAGVNLRQVALAVFMGAIVLILGLSETGLMPGVADWVSQITHLLAGLSAIGQAEGLAVTIRRGKNSAVQA
jgi:hypothetical protein